MQKKLNKKGGKQMSGIIGRFACSTCGYTGPLKPGGCPRCNQLKNIKEIVESQNKQKIKPELKHNEALLRQIIKRIDVNDCTGNSDLVMKIAKAYADEIIETPITSEPPVGITQNEIINTIEKLTGEMDHLYQEGVVIKESERILLLNCAKSLLEIATEYRVFNFVIDEEGNYLKPTLTPNRKNEH